MPSDSNAANSGSANFSVRMLRNVNEPSSVASDSVIGTYLPTIRAPAACVAGLLDPERLVAAEPVGVTDGEHLGRAASPW